MKSLNIIFAAAIWWNFPAALCWSGQYVDFDTSENIILIEFLCSLELFKLVLGENT
jgi:hypothetical protein